MGETMFMLKRAFYVLEVMLAFTGLAAAQYPAPVEADFVISNFRFASGETLPQLRIHYRTIGKPARDTRGVVTNAVLIMHGTTGTGAQFIRKEFAGELFNTGDMLDAARYYIILPDGM